MSKRSIRTAESLHRALTYDLLDGLFGRVVTVPMPGTGEFDE